MMIVNGVVMGIAKIKKVVIHVQKIVENVKHLLIVEMEYVMLVNVLLVVTKTAQSLNVKMEFVNLKKEKIV